MTTAVSKKTKKLKSTKNPGLDSKHREKEKERRIHYF